MALLSNHVIKNVNGQLLESLRVVADFKFHD